MGMDGLGMGVCFDICCLEIWLSDVYTLEMWLIVVLFCCNGVVPVLMGLCCVSGLVMGAVCAGCGMVCGLGIGTFAV